MLASGSTKWKKSAQRCNGFNAKCNRRKTNETEGEIPEDLVEPCKVFVSDLRRYVTESMLQELLSPHAEVEKIIIIRDKYSKKSKGFGFVKVKTNEDVEKLLALPLADRYIKGHPVTIKRAKKKVILPGDDGYVRSPLSDRDFDLASPDPTQPSMHMLVDDVMFKIFSLLPTKTLVKCEGVCRRWQMLVYSHFSKKSKLNISEDFLGMPPLLSKAAVSKVLILSGLNLKSLTVQKIDFVARQNILKIIGQLCPNLEILNISKSRGINFYQIPKLALGCKGLKGFLAQGCLQFDDKALWQLVTAYPQLEILDVSGTSVYGKNLRFLPNTLKELYIDRIQDQCHKENNIKQIADSCPNIEVLEMNECLVSNNDLEYIGKACPNLTKLTVYMLRSVNTASMTNLKKLKDLTLVGDTVDLNQLFTTLPHLEALTVDTAYIGSEEVDFSVLEKLRMLKLTQTAVSKASLQTLARCKQLEEFYLYKWYTLPEEAVADIIKGCPKMKTMIIPSMILTPEFIKKVDHIMKGRPGKVVIEARDSNIILSEIQYDRNKIEFAASRHYAYLYDPFEYDSVDSDSDVSFDAGWYDSDIDFPDQYFLDEHDFHDDLFEAAVMLAAWNFPDSDLY